MWILEVITMTKLLLLNICRNVGIYIYVYVYIICVHVREKTNSQIYINYFNLYLELQGVYLILPVLYLYSLIHDENPST